MRCQSVLPRLSRYLESDLPATQREAIAQHLESCASCRAEADSLRAAERALQSLSAVEPAPELLADLRRRLTAPAARPMRWAWAGLAAAAAVVVLIALRPASRSAPSPPPRSPGAPRTEAKHEAPTPPVVVVAPQRPITTARSDGATRRAPVRQPTQAAVLRPVEPVISAPEIEPALTEMPAMETAPAPEGIILVLGAPEPVLPSSQCQLEIRLEDGTRSMFTQLLERDETGRLQTATVSYQTVPPESPAPSQGG